ncbi:MAG: PAS domain S-box protein [bacterium]
MKERILVVIKDEGLLEESATALYKHNYLVTKVSNLSEMESQLHSNRQDVLLLDSRVWIEDHPDLIPNLGKNYSETSIIHLIPNNDKDKFDSIFSNGEEGGRLLQPVTGKEILVMVDQVIKHKQLKERFNQMQNELLEANKNLSNRTKEFHELISFHEKILQSITLGIITIDKGFIITSWNPGIINILSIDESVAKGSNLFDIIPALGWEKVSGRIKSVIHNGEVTELGHLKTKKPDGDEIYANYKFSPIKKEEETVGAVIIAENITQKIRLKDELNRAHGYISYLVENSTDAIIGCDLDGVIVTWNKGAEMMFGFSSQESIGRPWDFLFAEKDRKKMQNLFQWVKKCESISNFETQIISMSGEPIPISLTISLIKDINGNVYGVSGIAKELSKTKKLKKQFIQSQKMISLGTMAASMAHDINNPLASLSTYTHLLMTRTERIGISELTGNLSKVEEDADRIGQLVKDLLWYSIPSDHSMGMIDIHEILNKSLLFTGYQVNMDNIDIKGDYSAKKSRIMGNSRELIQAFVNIFTNAVESMPEGGIISIRTQSMDNEGLQNDQDEISIKISDTGTGIPEENLPHIFEQFFTTKSDEERSGLGLYVAYAIIEDHHGEIRVESKIDKGTCFTIHLPININRNNLQTNS